jgi:putative ABC transport system substrate-binding protein
VGDGFAHSLGRPGTNFTGLSVQLIETTGKRLELLKELVPGAAPVAFLWDPRGRPEPWQAAESAARERAWKLVSLEIRQAGEIETAFRTATRSRAGALLVHPSSLPDQHAKDIASLATKTRLPAMYGFRFYVEAGGLMAYGADAIEMWRRSAAFIDKIWKGAKPGDLPIEQPTKFELLINLKAARSIGLTVPRALQARADDLIQ